MTRRSRWARVTTLTGWMTGRFVKSYIDLGGVAHLIGMQFASVFTLQRNGSDFAWTGAETMTAIRTWTTFLRTGTVLIKSNEHGTITQPTETHLTCDLVNGLPAGYALEENQITVPVRWNSLSVTFGFPESIGRGATTRVARRPGTSRGIIPKRGFTLAGSRPVTDFSDVGYGRVEWRLEALSKRRPRYLDIWIDAFVPDTIDEVQWIQADTRNTESLYEGFGGASGRLFMTDQRGFSWDPESSARARSRIRFDLRNGVVSRARHYTSPTEVVRGDNGQTECGPTRSSTSRMRFENILITGDEGARRITFDTRAAVAPRCWPQPPDVGWVGHVEVLQDDGMREVRVAYDLSVQEFPAFEMYAELDMVNEARFPVVLVNRHPPAGIAAAEMAEPPGVQVQGEGILPYR